MQAGKVLPGGNPDIWLQGGLAFTHPQARYYIYHPGCDFGEISDWSDKIIYHTSEAELTFEQRLQIADRILSRAKKLGDFPNEIKDAKAIVEPSYEKILQDLESSTYIDGVEDYLRETEELVAEYRAYAQISIGEEMARPETES